MQNSIVFSHVKKAYGKTVVIEDLNLEIREGERLILLGPSGCGKTTTLRMIAGFEEISGGELYMNGKVVNDLPPGERNIAMVFQSYALFPHLSVWDNITFGLQLQKLPADEIRKRAEKALEILHLKGYEHKKTHELSGGQKQRVALCRAIVKHSPYFLLDEPLSNLDAKLRVGLRSELKKLQKNLGITTLYVTHDQEEALTMSDTIVVMDKGCIQQIGTPEDIYNEPENAFVADFIGDSNIFDAVMIQDKLVKILDATFPCVDTGFGTNKPVDAVIRPEDVELVSPEDGLIRGVVTHLIFKGVHYEMEVTANGFEWLVHSTGMYPVGTPVGIKVDPFNIQIMHKPESEDEEATAIDE